MAQNYTRQSAFSDGDTITATLFNDEYNQLVNTFTYSSSDASATGHRHDGSTGEGGNIYRIGDLDFLNKIEADSVNNRWGFWVEVSSIAVEQLRIQDGAIVPVTDNDIDLGTSSLEFKNLYLDGTAKVDALVVDETATITGAATLSSDLTVTGNTTLNGNTTLGNAATDTVTIAADVSSNIIPSADSTYTLGDSSNYWSAGYIDAITTTGNVSVGGNLTVTGNATISGNLTFGDADTDTVSFSADVSSHILPDVDDTYDLGSSTKEWRNLYVDGTANIDSLVADTADINGGTIDGAIIGGASAAAGTFTTANATTVDTTNIEVTNLKAKDGTAAGSIADTTGVVTLASSVLTTTDINGGTIDGATIGATTPAAGTFTTGDFNTSLNVDGTVTADGLTVDAGGTLRLDASSTTDFFTIIQGGTQAVLTADSPDGAGNMLFRTAAAGVDLDRMQIASGGDISFYEDTGTTAQLVWDASADALTFGDSVKATFGAGSDLQIYHDGSDSFILDNGAGNLAIRGSSAIFLQSPTGETYLKANNNGSVDLYYDNSAKLATTSTGIDVTGTVTADGLDVDTGDAGNGLNYGFDVKNAASGSATSYAMPAISWSNGGLRWASVHGERNPAGGYGGSFVVNTMNSAGSAVKRLDIASTGDISFYEDTGTTPKFFWDASAESLGIGTTTTAISSKLQVASTTTALDSGGTIFASTTDSPAADIGGQVMMGGYYTGTSVAAFGGMAAKKSNATDGNYDGYLQFLTSTHPTGNTEKMRIDASGNVGIGTSSPAFYQGSGLEIERAGIATVRLQNTTSSKSAELKIDTDLTLETINTGSGILFNTGATERMRIDSSGNLLVGTTSSTYKVDVTVSGNNGIRLQDGTNQIYLGWTGGNAATGTLTNVPYTFVTNGTEAARIDSSGNLLVGKTATNYNNDGFQAFAGGFVHATGTQAVANSGTVATLNRKSTDGSIVDFRKDGTTVGSIGSYSGTDTYITGGSGNSTGVVITANAIVPSGAAGATNANIDLGLSATGRKFKDLYLTGTANAAGLSVDGGTIKLDGNYPVGTSNVALGDAALSSGSLSGGQNVAVGAFVLDANTTGASNTAVGYVALTNNSTGNYNTGLGEGALAENTTASNNTAVGYQSLYANTTGAENVAVGKDALAANTTGNSNTATGMSALVTNTTGTQNVADGGYALRRNTTGSYNTASGFEALEENTTADSNTAVGYQSLNSNTTGSNNTAVGRGSLTANTTAGHNVAVGFNSLTSNTTGEGNLAIGAYSLNQNTTGAGNTAIGTFQAGLHFGAMYANTVGSNNTAMGVGALDANTSGGNNTAIGYVALSSNSTASNNTAVGHNALLANTTGTQNVALGAFALDASTTASDHTALGYGALSANTTGTRNTAVGSSAMVSTTTGSENVAVGRLALRLNTTGQNNVAVGHEALDKNTTASYSTAVGYQALYNSNRTADVSAANTAVGNTAGYSTTSGQYNVFLGAAAGYTNTTGTKNTALGFEAGYSTTTVSGGVYVGYRAGFSLTGGDNTLIGFESAQSQTTGQSSTSLGYRALYSASTGSFNVALGKESLYSNTTASNNTAVGFQAGYAVTTGEYNNFFGQLAGDSLTTGVQNTIIGRNAGSSATTTSYNTFLGNDAGRDTVGTSNIGDNTFIGQGAGYLITTGYRNTILGRFNGNQGGLDIRTSSNNIVLSDGDGNPRGYYHGGLSSPSWFFDTPTLNQWAMQLRHTTASANTAYGLNIKFTSIAPNDTTRKFLDAADSVGIKLTIFSNGNVVNQNNSYGAISDIKLKENIVDSGSQWDDIKALKVRKYSMKADALDAPNRLGVIAQEVEAAGMGGLVFETPDIDAETKEELGTVTKQVNYSVLYMKAVKALQEAMERIETLEAKVAALEAN